MELTFCDPLSNQSHVARLLFCVVVEEKRSLAMQDYLSHIGI